MHDDFDGATYDSSLDKPRLTRQLDRVRTVMTAASAEMTFQGGWLTLSEIARRTAAPEASVSARLRDLRKQKFGSWRVQHRRVGQGGTWQYRLLPPSQGDLFEN